LLDPSSFEHTIGAQALHHYYADTPEWLFWSVCYYYKLTWALLSFPFLIFIVRSAEIRPRYARIRPRYARDTPEIRPRYSGVSELI